MESVYDLTNKEVPVNKHNGHSRTRGKCRKDALSMFYTLIKHGFLTNQSVRRSCLYYKNKFKKIIYIELFILS